MKAKNTEVVIEDILRTLSFSISIKPPAVRKKSRCLIFSSTSEAKKAKGKLDSNGVANYLTFEREKKKIFFYFIHKVRKNNPWYEKLEDLRKKGMPVISFLGNSKSVYLKFINRKKAEDAFAQLSKTDLPQGFENLRISSNQLSIVLDRAKEQKEAASDDYKPKTTKIQGDRVSSKTKTIAENFFNPSLDQFDSYQLLEELKRRRVHSDHLEGLVHKDKSWENAVEIVIEFLRSLKHKHGIVCVFNNDPVILKGQTLWAKSAGKEKLDECLLEFVSKRK